MEIHGREAALSQINRPFLYFLRCLHDVYLAALPALYTLAALFLVACLLVPALFIPPTALLTAILSLLTGLVSPFLLGSLFLYYSYLQHSTDCPHLTCHIGVSSQYLVAGMLFYLLGLLSLLALALERKRVVHGLYQLPSLTRLYSPLLRCLPSLLLFCLFSFSLLSATLLLWAMSFTVGGL